MAGKKTSLHVVAYFGMVEVGTGLLGAGADANNKADDGSTPLYSASWNGHNAVHRLLEAGTDIHTKNKDGWTPLHWASEYGHDAVVQSLLKAGADINAKDKDGGTPLHRASGNGHDGVASILSQLGLSRRCGGRDFARIIPNLLSRSVSI